VTALKAGHWVLLDEINLASAETLECLSGLLESSSGSLVLADRGRVFCIHSTLAPSIVFFTLMAYLLVMCH